MFYFAHPFGIASPATSTTTNINHQSQNSTPYHDHRKGCVRRKSRSVRHTDYEAAIERHVSSYIPWPEDTWKRDYILPPLVQLLATQLGKLFIPLHNLILTARSFVLH